jgi:hypothetical protein
VYELLGVMGDIFGQETLQCSISSAVPKLILTPLHSADFRVSRVSHCCGSKCEM